MSRAPTGHPAPVVPRERRGNPYLEGNYAPVFDERSDDHDLEVTGLVPPDLDGHLLRNGPNPAVLPTDDTDYHWFGGDGMIHDVTLGGGRALGYRNRWCGPANWPPNSAPPSRRGRPSRSTAPPTPT